VSEREGEANSILYPGFSKFKVNTVGWRLIALQSEAH